MPRTSGFETVAQVKSYQDNLLSIFGFNKTSVDASRLGTEVLKEELMRLRSLQKTLEDSEQSLFERLGIKDINELKAKLEIWQKSGAQSLISNQGNFWNLFRTTVNMIQMEDWNARLNEILNSNTLSGDFEQIFFVSGVTVAELDPKIKEILMTSAIEAFNGVLGTGSTNFRITSAAKSYISGQSTNGILGLARYITFVEVPNTNPPTVQISFSENMPSTYRKRIIEVLKAKGVTDFNKQTIGMSVSQTTLDKIIDNILSGIYGAPRHYVKNVLRQYLGAFDFQKNPNAVKGALGEIYWTAFWQYVSNGKVMVTPVGKQTMTNTDFSGQQLPMDIIIDGLGLQVKNYTINDQGEAIFGKNDKEMTLEGYVKNRLQIPVEPFQNFFFSYGYNQVIPNATHNYDAIFNRFEAILNKLQNGLLQQYSEARMDKILRMDMSFTSNVDHLFNRSMGDLKYNVIYLINNKMVFASDIVRAIITQLQGDVKITFKSFDFQYHQPDVGATWGENKEATKSPAAALAGNTISYSIALNVNELLRRAIYTI